MAESGLKVLAIDDEEESLSLLQATLEKAFSGVVFFTAPDGRAGLARALAEDPDVILLDIRLPEVDGFEVCRRLKADGRLADIPVIFLTALKIKNELRVKALEAGAEALLTKPFKEDDLVSHIQMMVKLKAGNAARRKEKERLAALLDERTHELIEEADGHKLAEDEREAAEGRYRSIFFAMTEGFALHEVICDKAGKPVDYRFLEVNPAFEKITGMRRAAVVGRTMLEVRPDVDKGLVEALGHVALTRKELRLEEFRSYLDPRKVFSATVFSPAAGQFAMIFTDVTERKRTREALEESERSYRALFEQAYDAIALLEPVQDGSPRIVDANPVFLNLHGYTREELVGKTISFLDEDPDMQRATAERLEFLNKNGKASFETRHRCKDGSIIVVESSVRLITLGDRRVIIDISRDITGRKAAEEKISRLNLQNELILSSAAEGILGLNLEGRHTFVNPAAAKMLGYAPGELIGRPSHSTWHHTKPDGSSCDEAECRILSAPSKGETCYDPDGLFWRKDGTSFPVEYSSTPINDGGKCTGVVVTFTDTSERKRAERDLLEERQQLDAIVESSPVGLLIVDEDINIVRANSAVAAIAGVKLEDIVPHRPGNVLGCVNAAPDPRGCGYSPACALCPLRQALAGLLGGGEPLRGEEIQLTIQRAGKEEELGLLVGAERIMLEGRPHAVVSLDDITGKKRAEASEEKSRSRYAAIFGRSPIAIEYYDAEGALVGANEACIELFGVVDIAEIAGFSLFDDPNIDGGVKERLRRGELVHVEAGFDFGKVKELKLYRTTKSGKIILDYHIAPMLEHGKKTGYVVQIQDITARRAAETRTNRRAELLSVINSSGDLNKLMRRVTLLLQDWTGCEAVGVRLKDGEDFPYFETRGFSAEFATDGCSLCSYGQDGLPREDRYGSPVLECICGRVIQGHFDPAQPFFTAKGSFWTNSATEHMAWGTGAGSKARTRCKDEGYESVALVQLRSGVEVLGLLQFNSKQKGRFDAELIAFLEDAADQLAVAAAHLKAGEALRKSETRLLKAQSMASVGNWEIKLKTGEVWASEEARRIYNFSMGERLTLESVLSAPLPEYREKLDLAMRELAEGKGNYDLEFELKQANSGAVVWVRSQAELVLGENGEPMAAGVTRDITAEKKAEEELRARETKFAEFFRNMTSGVAMYKAVEGGEDFVFADINPAGEILSRVKREAVLGRRLLEIFPEAEKIGFLGLLREVWRTGRPAYLPERLYQDGRLSQWVENRIIKLPSGEVVSIYDDVTQRRAAQDSIKASLAEKEVLLKEIHHRVKNNLQVVSSLLNLQAKTMKNAAAAAAFRESRSRVHAMALVHETLYRSHDLATLDMREYIGKLLDSLRGSCSAGSAVSFEKDIKSCSLCVDTAVCIGLILNELVSNSLKHAFADGRSGTIKVTLAGEKDGYRLEVADDGPGLPADYDLKRAESLGMQLVASLARQISGTVEAAPGAGSRFVLRFRG